MSILKCWWLTRNSSVYTEYNLSSYNTAYIIVKHIYCLICVYNLCLSFVLKLLWYEVSSVPVWFLDVYAVCLHSRVLANQISSYAFTSPFVKCLWSKQFCCAFWSALFYLYTVCVCVYAHQQARKHILEIHTRDWSPKLAEPFVNELAEKCVGKMDVKVMLF